MRRAKRVLTDVGEVALVALVMAGFFVATIVLGEVATWPR